MDLLISLIQIIFVINTKTALLSSEWVAATAAGNQKEIAVTESVFDPTLAASFDQRKQQQQQQHEHQQQQQQQHEQQQQREIKFWSLGVALTIINFAGVIANSIVLGE